MHDGAWVVFEDGARRRVSEQGLLVGRAATCDIVLSEPRASKRHALVCLGASGVEIHPLGRNTTKVNGREITGARRLAHGDRIEVPGASFSVDRPQERLADHAPVWLVRVGEILHRVPGRPLKVGGGDDDELVVPEWPKNAVTLQLGGASLIAEAGAAGGRLGDVEAAIEELHALRSGDVLRFGDRDVEVLAEQRQEETTVASLESLRLRVVRFHYRPTGGELSLQIGDRLLSCPLSELRSRLVVVLLQPPGGYAAGDFIPDELVIPRIWPRRDDRTNFDVNTLVHRLRKDLLKTGVDPTRFIERARTGGATRFRLQEGAEVLVA